MSKPKPLATKAAAAAAVGDTPALLADLRQLIEQARQSAAVAVNAGLTQLYWRVGQRIRSEVLGDARAGYGQEILPTLSAELMPRLAGGSVPAACGAWCSLPRPLQTLRLSRRCRDNWPGATSWS